MTVENDGLGTVVTEIEKPNTAVTYETPIQQPSGETAWQTFPDVLADPLAGSAAFVEGRSNLIREVGDTISGDFIINFARPPASFSSSAGNTPPTVRIDEGTNSWPVAAPYTAVSTQPYTRSAKGAVTFSFSYADAFGPLETIPVVVNFEEKQFFGLRNLSSSFVPDPGSPWFFDNFDSFVYPNWDASWVRSNVEVQLCPQTITTSYNLDVPPSSPNCVFIGGTLNRINWHPASAAGRTIRTLRRQFTLPNRDCQLSYAIFLATRDTITYDQQFVKLYNSGGVTVLRTFSNECTNRGVWRTYTWDLSAYKGQTVWLEFGVSDDGDPPGEDYTTWMYVDNVQIQTGETVGPVINEAFIHGLADTSLRSSLGGVFSDSGSGTYSLVIATTYGMPNTYSVYTSGYYEGDTIYWQLLAEVPVTNDFGITSTYSVYSTKNLVDAGKTYSIYKVSGT